MILNDRLIFVYPNPSVSKLFNIEISKEMLGDSHEVKLDVFNSISNKINSQLLQADNFTGKMTIELDLSETNESILFLRIKTKNHEKFIKLLTNK